MMHHFSDIDIPLPHATLESQLRYRVALALASLCPPSLGQEICLTGSVSKGFADTSSLPSIINGSPSGNGSHNPPPHLRFSRPNS